MPMMLTPLGDGEPVAIDKGRHFFWPTPGLRRRPHGQPQGVAKTRLHRTD